MVAGKAVEIIGMNIEEEQEILMATSDMLIAVYTAESALLRAEKLAAEKGEEAASLQINMAKLYLHNSVENIQSAGREAIYSFTEGDDQRLLLMGLKRFTKYSNPINPKLLRREIAKVVIEDNGYKS